MESVHNRYTDLAYKVAANELTADPLWGDFYEAEESGDKWALIFAELKLAVRDRQNGWDYYRRKELKRYEKILFSKRLQREANQKFEGYEKKKKIKQRQHLTKKYNSKRYNSKR